MRKVSLTDAQLAIVLDALIARLEMGRFELNELHHHFNGVANDAVIYTERRVRDLEDTITALKEQLTHDWDGGERA